ncbi:hypothetical protein [Magnetovibrio sp.]|uniref:hypothetical protein n=1 Tax=Magnetovibrio sp. TaxID=2024836 RepID=UPI002F9285F8
MIRTLTITIATLAPTAAFAHTDGHAEMALTAELAHMLSDPLHVALIAAVAGAVALGYKAWRTKTPARQKTN